MNKPKNSSNKTILNMGLGLLACALVFGISTKANAQPRVVNEEVSVSQQRLLLQGAANGGYSVRKVLESGGQFFSTPYVPDDGMGEGEFGPKAAQRMAFYPIAENFPPLKMNGLGAQSCFDCHYSIGSYVKPGYESGALIRKPQAVGGAGGLAANLFQNPDFPDQFVKFYRNPPHVFGTGYTQRLATEITHDLQLAKEAAKIAAELNPGVQQSISLDSKGNNYGVYKTTYTAGENGAPGTFTEDLSSVDGVPSDLVVRPFQHKGIASSLRHFVMSALDFHFSVQPVEVVGYNADTDMDGKFNEMSVDLSEGPASATPELTTAADISFGNVTALTAFVGMTRSPQVQIEPGKEESVARGEALFMGNGIANLPAEAAGMCASCHRPSMKVELPVFTVDEPDILGDLSYRSNAGLGDSTVPNTESLPVVKAFTDVLASYKNHPSVQDAMANPQNAAADFYTLLQSAQEELDQNFLPTGYHIDLITPGKLNGDAPEDIPAYVYPRLAANADGTLDVPLFSDLKLHDLGEGMMDVEDQEVDVDGVYVEKRHYLTRPLWGVADSGPWLHDGRAFDLNTAIRYHKSEGSAANPVIEVYEGFSDTEREDLLNFLLSMRLPIVEELTETSKYTLPTNTPVPTPTGSVPGPTSTPTPTPTATPVSGGTTPLVIVTDATGSTADLSGGQDADADNDRALLIDWNITYSQTISDFHIYVRINGSGDFQYLGRTANGSVTELEWRADAANLNSTFAAGPQFNTSYQFAIFAITESGSPAFIGDFTNPTTNSAPVELISQ